jgi:hypothetical protein
MVYALTGRYYDTKTKKVHGHKYKGYFWRLKGSQALPSLANAATPANPSSDIETGQQYGSMTITRQPGGTKATSPIQTIAASEENSSRHHTTTPPDGKSKRKYNTLCEEAKSASISIDTSAPPHKRPNTMPQELGGDTSPQNNQSSTPTSLPAALGDNEEDEDDLCDYISV